MQKVAQQGWVEEPTGYGPKRNPVSLRVAIYVK